jgi:uncharacterized membrane protein
MKKKISLYVMAAFYLLAGINHFRSPQNYYAIIPPYIGHVYLVNIISGVAEILAAILLMIPATRKWSCYGIIAMLFAFVPAHVYMIQANCSGAFCLPVWILWVRLILLQPLLIWWAWWNRK